MPRRPSDKAWIGFMALWLVFWTAAILTAIWYMGEAALRGEPAAAIFLAVWLGAAGLGLWTGGRKLVRLMLVGRAPRARRSAITAGTTGSIRPRAGRKTGQIGRNTRAIPGIKLKTTALMFVKIRRCCPG